MSRSGLRQPWDMRSGDMPDGPQNVPPPLRRAPPGGPTIVYDPHRYAKLVGEQNLAVASTGTGTLVLAEPDTRRNLLMMRNTSATANIYVAFGNYASLTSVVILSAGTMILFDTVVPQDDVYAFADAAAGFLTVAQSVIPY